MIKKFFKVPNASAAQVLGIVLKQCESAGTTFMLLRLNVGHEQLNAQITGWAASTLAEMAAALVPSAGPLRDEWTRKLTEMAA